MSDVTARARVSASRDKRDPATEDVGNTQAERPGGGAGETKPVEAAASENDVAAKGNGEAAKENGGAAKGNGEAADAQGNGRGGTTRAGDGDSRKMVATDGEVAESVHARWTHDHATENGSESEDDGAYPVMATKEKFLGKKRGLADGAEANVIGSANVEIPPKERGQGNSKEC